MTVTLGLAIIEMNTFFVILPGVDVNGADGHDFLPVPFGERAQQESDEVVKLSDLFLVVVFDGVLVALLELAEGDAHLVGPPNLGAAKRDLGRVVE